jgi:hypothetical protein
MKKVRCIEGNPREGLQLGARGVGSVGLDPGYALVVAGAKPRAPSRRALSRATSERGYILRACRSCQSDRE